MTFWGKFYNLCVSNGVKPNTVAKELGFSSAVCTQWKQGKQKPSYEKASKIAKYFNVPTDYLLSEEDITSPEVIENATVSVIEKISYQLKIKGLTATKMMKDLGFSTGLFSQWKSGLQKPSAEKLKAVADYLNVSVDYLLDESVIVKTYIQPEYLQAQKNAPVEKARAELNAELAELSEEEIDELIDFAKFLKSKKADL